LLYSLVLCMTYIDRANADDEIGNRPVRRRCSRGRPRHGCHCHRYGPQWRHPRATKYHLWPDRPPNHCAHDWHPRRRYLCPPCRLHGWLLCLPRHLASTSCREHLFPCGAFSYKHGGRVALMGGVSSAVSIPYGIIVHNDLKIFGKWMYSQEQVRRCIKMAETGVLALGGRSGVVTRGEYGLEEIEAAVERAGAESRWGAHVVVEPAMGMRK